MKNNNAIPEGHEVGDYYLKFKRATSEDTLDIMYEASIKKAERNFSGSELIRVVCEIERALDRRQTDFDTNERVFKQKMDTTRAKGATSFVENNNSSAEYDPEKELRRMLNFLNG